MASSSLSSSSSSEMDVIASTSSSSMENVKIIEWEEFEQELMRLWSLTSATNTAKERKLSLSNKLESLLQVNFLLFGSGKSHFRVFFRIIWSNFESFLSGIMIFLMNRKLPFKKSKKDPIFLILYVGFWDFRILIKFSVSLTESWRVHIGIPTLFVGRKGQNRDSHESLFEPQTFLEFLLSSFQTRIYPGF